MWEKLTSKEWWKQAGERAIKTLVQVSIATIGTSAMIENVNWLAVLSASALAGILSILTSIASIPVPENSETTDLNRTSQKGE